MGTCRRFLPPLALVPPVLGLLFAAACVVWHSLNIACVDIFGIEVTTAVPGCVEAINAYYEAVLAYRPFPSWSIVESAVEHDPDCPLARLLVVDYTFSIGKVDEAQTLLRQLQTDSTRESSKLWKWREHRYVDAWAKWILQDDPASFYDLLFKIVARHPSDLFAVKRGQMIGLRLRNGDRVLRIVEEAAA